MKTFNKDDLFWLKIKVRTLRIFAEKDISKDPNSDLLKNANLKLEGRIFALNQVIHLIDKAIGDDNG